MGKWGTWGTRGSRDLDEALPRRKRFRVVLEYGVDYNICPAVASFLRQITLDRRRCGYQQVVWALEVRLVQMGAWRESTCTLVMTLSRL